MSSRQSIGLILLFKALAWKDTEGTVWIVYYDPQFLVDHGISNRQAVASTMSGALEALKPRQAPSTEALWSRRCWAPSASGEVVLGNMYNGKNP